MKKVILIAGMACLALTLSAQSPVNWNFSAKKIADNTYEVHLVATVAEPWKIYSQQTPDGGPLPTVFTFTKNPLITLDGKVKEVGDMKKAHEEVFGVDVLYYKGKVDFVQVVKLKTSAKTRLTGSLEYMACNEEQCLPPATVPFTVALE